MHLFSTLSGEFLSVLRGIGDSADKAGSTAYLIGAFPRSIIYSEDYNDLEIIVCGKIEKTVSVFINTYTSLHSGMITRKQKSAAEKSKSKYLITNPYIPENIILFTKANSIETAINSRGFSIDSLTISLSSKNFAHVIDKTGSLADLHSKTLRVISMNSFTNNPKYVYRAFYYIYKYNLSIDPVTDILLNKAIKEKIIENISNDDINDEVKLIKSLNNNMLISKLRSLEILYKL